MNNNTSSDIVSSSDNSDKIEKDDANKSNDEILTSNTKNQSVDLENSIVSQNNPSSEDICELYLSLNKDQEINSQNYLFSFPEKLQEKYPNCQPYKLLANAFSYFVITENELFQKFCDVGGSIDSLLDHYIPFINIYDFINSEDNEMRLQMIRSITFLFLSHANVISRYEDLLKDYFSVLLVIMDRADILSQIEAFRCATSIYSSCSDQFPLKIQRLWLFRIVAYSQPSSVLQYMAVNFVTEVYRDDFQFIPLCNVLIKRGIENTDSISAIESYLKLAVNEDPFDIYIFLIRLLIQHHYLSRSAADIICNTLEVFICDGNSTTINYILFLFRKLMLFYAYANKNKQYKYRQFLINLMYDKIVTMPNIKSFRKSIQEILNAIVRNGYLQDLKDKVKDVAIADELTDCFLKEKGFPLNDNKKLKLFALYPYDSEIDSSLIENDYSDQSDSDMNY